MSRDPFVLAERAIAMGNSHGKFDMLCKTSVHVNEILVDVYQFALRRPRRLVQNNERFVEDGQGGPTSV